MKYIRKSLVLLLIVAVMGLFNFSQVFADPNPSSDLIYENTTKKIITSGVTLEEITRFTGDGWNNINVLRVDLSNKYINVGTMSNDSSLNKLTTTKALAAANNAIAAINGGFFIWDKALPGTGYPIGPIVDSGSISTASEDFNKYSDSMATFSISNVNQVLFDYWKTSMSIIAPNGNSSSVARYNKDYSGYKDLSIIDSKASKKSIGTDSPAGCPDIVEMFVIDGKVAEIRKGQPSAPIPDNGYVVITRAGGGDAFLLNNFVVGDQVQFNISTTPDWTKIKTALTGGAILIKDGKIPSQFSHYSLVDGAYRAPRTALGCSKDGKQLILVTVDGRSRESIGMSLDQLAQLMSELGAYDALNLDGGGSTTMVAREPGATSLSTINNPSDGSLRKVSTALGVFSLAPPSELNGLILDTSDTNVFVNTSRAITVKGFDKYFNPINVDSSKIKWSVTGVKGTFKDNTFYPTSVGTAKIKATYGNVSGTFEVSVLSSPVQLMLSSSELNLTLNSTKSFSITGKNKNGFYATISPSDIKWTVKGNLGTVSNGVFTATEQGTGYIDAAVGTTHAYCSVSVKTEKTTVLDRFEKINGSFMADPKETPGSYSISGEQMHSLKSSGKINYDFQNLEGTRAAYLVLNDGGYSLSKDSKKIGLWVYNTHESANWIAAWVLDGKGAQHSVYFTKNTDWTGWKYLEASLDGIDSPSKLTRLYVVQPNPVSDVGEIFMDDLSVTTSAYPVIDKNSIPKDTTPVDEANKAVAYVKGTDNFRFSVFGQSSEPKNPLEKLLLSNLASKTNSFLEAGALVGDSTHTVASTYKKPVISTNTGFKSFDIKNSRFIQLDMSKNGLRLSSKYQWNWLKSQLSSSKGDNVFIFLANSPINFSDDREADLFQKVLSDYKLSSGKNVWVFYNGQKNSSYMEKGVKYISSAGFNVEGLTAKNTSPAKYILVTVKGKSVSYEYKSIT